MKRNQDFRDKRIAQVLLAEWRARQLSVRESRRLSGIISGPGCTRRDRKQRLHRRLNFADRLRGPSGAGVADAPVRRIGIQVWQTHFWHKRLVTL